MERYAGMTKQAIRTAGKLTDEEFDFGFETTRSKKRKSGPNPFKKKKGKETEDLTAYPLPKATIGKAVRKTSPKIRTNSMKIGRLDWRPYGKKWGMDRTTLFHIPFDVSRVYTPRGEAPQKRLIHGKIIAFSYPPSRDDIRLRLRFKVIRPSLRPGNMKFAKIPNDENIWPLTGDYRSLEELLKGIREAFDEEEKWSQEFDNRYRKDLNDYMKAQARRERK